MESHKVFFVVSTKVVLHGTLGRSVIAHDILEGPPRELAEDLWVHYFILLQDVCADIFFCILQDFTT